jgi:hypothetical protein
VQPIARAIGDRSREAIDSMVFLTMTLTPFWLRLERQPFGSAERQAGIDHVSDQVT